MADITVRKIRFSFDGPIDFDLDDQTFSSTMSMLALSLTMPYLEPYLIRTMRPAIEKISDPQLAEDARRFSQQEGHHYRNHALFNKQIRAQFEEQTSNAILAIEEALEADYQRFTKTKSLRFNLAYAEGFEAMTCASALAMAEHGGFDRAEGMPGGEIWAWHMAEEIEHRAVAFDVYDHLVGSYPYRLIFGTWAQYHYVSYIRRFALCMAGALGRNKLVRPKGPMYSDAGRRYLSTLRPSYDPAKIVVPESVEGLLARYSEMAAA